MDVFEKTNRKKKFFLANKLDMSSTLRDRVIKSFANSENYLQEVPNIIFGKIPKGPRENPKTRKLILHSVIGDDSIINDFSKIKKKISISKQNIDIPKQSSFIKKTTSRSNETTNTGSVFLAHMSSAKTMSNQQSLQKSNYVEVVDDKKLSLLFENYRSLINENKIKQLNNKNLNSIEKNKDKYFENNYPLREAKTSTSLSNYNFNCLTTPDHVNSTNMLNISHYVNTTGNNNSNTICKTDSNLPNEFKRKLDYQEKTLSLHEANELKRKKV
jgi:hypothetical protein